MSALRVNPPNPVIPRIRKEDVAVGADCETMHSIESRLTCRSAIAAVSFFAGSSQHRQLPDGIDLEHAFATRHFRDVSIAREIEIDSERTVHVAIRRASADLGSSASEEHQRLRSNRGHRHQERAKNE